MSLRSQFLIHEVAFEMSKEIVPVFAPLLREEDLRDAFDEIYERVKAGLEEYHAKVIWLVTRIGTNN